MEKIVKAIEIGGIVNTFIGNILDPIIEVIEFGEENITFLRKYFHEHPDETDKLKYEFKLPFSLTKNYVDMHFEFIVKKKTAIRRR